MTQLRETVRWGIIGVGDVVEHKSGPAFATLPGSELVAVMRRTGGLARDFAVRHGVRSWYDDGDALLADPDVDAVYVATPPDAHADWTVAAAAAGKPVYVEKPMARSTGECRRMVRACEAAGVPLFVAYYRRALPRFEAAREAIASGRLGTVHAVVVRHQQPAREAGTGGWRVDPAVSGGGLFVDLASHTLDWLDHVFGPLTDVIGTADSVDGGPAETRVTAHFGLGDAVRGLALWDFAAAEPYEQVEVVGDRATLRIAMFNTSPVTITGPDGTEALEIANPPVVQQPMVAAVVDSLRTGAPAPSTGHSALRTTRVIDRLLSEHRRRHGILPHPAAD